MRLRTWFPLVWLLLAAGCWAALVAASRGDMPPDRQTILTIALGNLTWMGLVFWFLFFWPRLDGWTTRNKWFLRLAVAGMVVGAFRSLDVDYYGDGRWQAVRLRWWPAPDERLDSLDGDQVIDDWQTTELDYPRFLGSGYWAEAPAVRIDTDWNEHPPKLLWKQKIGAGWSSWAVVGRYAVTQEQRAGEEMTTCYEVATGRLVWSHADPVRHDPKDVGGGMGGVGPRATPTVAGERVYTLGATAVLNCLDARSGDVVWSHDLKTFGIEPLFWGTSASPLVVPAGDLVIVSPGRATDTEKGSLFAFKASTGEAVWRSGPGASSYASPVQATLAGVEQVVQVSEDVVGGYRLADGEELWSHALPGKSNADATCSQPIPLAGDRLLLTKGYGEGSRLLQLEPDGDGVKVEPIWARPVMQTKFANLVVRDGYAYGLDQGMLSCIEIATGKRKWKKRRQPPLGHGQVLLVGEVILVTSEEGEGVLVRCNSKRYDEVASHRLLSADGIGWNHPALSGKYLLVRNNLEAACYELELQDP